MKKYWYIGSDSVFIDRGSFGPKSRQGIWAKETLIEATVHAQKVLADNPNKDEVFIVEVVRVVKRKLPDVMIEDVE